MLFFFNFANKKNKINMTKLSISKHLKLNSVSLTLETNQEGDSEDLFIMLNEGQIIHSSCGSTEWVQVIEVYNSDGNLYGKYKRYDNHDKDDAIIWYKIEQV